MGQVQFEKYPFAAKSPSLIGLWSNDNYPSECLGASKIIAAILAEKITFDELLHLLGTIRNVLHAQNPEVRHSINTLYEQAEIKKNPIGFFNSWMIVYRKNISSALITDFGKLRKQVAQTPVSKENRYKDMIDDLEKIFHKQTQGGKKLDIQLEYNGVRICYSEIICLPGQEFFIQHTPPNSLKYAKKIAGSLLEDILNYEYDATDSTNEAELLKLIGQFNWHLNQAMFFERGSASITELLTTAIFLYKKISLPAYNETTTCDLKAIFSQSVESYVEQFTGFLFGKKKIILYQSLR